MSTDAQSVPENAQVRPSFNPLKASPEELEQRIADMKKQAQPEETETEEEPKETPTEPENETSNDLQSELEKAEKRYKDLQSYSDKRYNSLAEKVDQLVQQNTALEKQLAEASKVKPKAPLSDEEFEALTKDFPNVDSIAHQRALKLYEEMSAPLYNEIQELKKELGKSKELTAKEQLRKLHPDFEKLETDPDFIQWFQEQPAGVQGLIQSSNIKDIAKGLDYYKLERGIKSDKEKKLDASAAVDTKTPTKAATTPPRKTPLSEVRAKMADLSKRGGKKLEEYVDWYNKAKAEGQIDFNQ